MPWLSWFKRSPKEPDYETVLSSLSASIKDRESLLLSINKRERSANALFITYGLGAWVVYFTLWYFNVILGRNGNGADYVIGWAITLGGPVAILFTRRIMRLWFTRQKNKEEQTLIGLKKEQRDKVEELKTKTGYYSTRNLLEKYDEVVKKNAEVRGLNPVGPNGQPQRPRPQTAGGAPSTPTKAGVQPPPGTPRHLLPPAPPSTPVQRTVFDKLADALLGVSGEEGLNTPNNKYALICGKCFAHNGLVVKEEFDTIQYQCPRCGHFNPRRLGGLRPSNGVDSGRRRVQSMHAPSYLAKSDLDSEPEEEKEAQKKDLEQEGGMDAPVEEMKEIGGEEKKLRQRKTKSKDDGEMMDVDS